MSLARIDVRLFFDYLKESLINRLYRRYLRLEDPDMASALMAQVKWEFAALSNKAINWQDMTTGPAKTWLDPSKETLAEIFGK